MHDVTRKLAVRTLRVNGERLYVGRAAIIIVVATLFSGCTSITKRVGTDEDVHERRNARDEEITRDFEARRDMAQHQAAITRLRHNDVATARAMLETILARNPEYLPSRLALAELLLDANQPEEALQHAQFVVERAPRDGAARHVEGLIFETLGRSDEALASFQQAVDGAPDNELYRLSFETSAEAIASTGEQKRPEGLPHPAPQDAHATLQAAAAAFERNDAEESIQLLSPALKHAPDDVRLLRMLGVSHYRRGEYGPAQVVLAKAVSLDATDPLSYFLLGATLRQMGQTTDADRHLATAANLDPRYATWR
jgi:Flp pilus assembly protein TadD